MPRLALLLFLVPGVASAQVPAGGEFPVNAYTTGAQDEADVAFDGRGQFVVAWSSDGEDGSGRGVFARRHSARGVPLGAAFQVNTYTPQDQRRPRAACDTRGRCVVAWSSAGQDGSGLGIFARRFAPDGAPIGAEFQVNTTTAMDQAAPDVAMSPAGASVLVWMGPNGVDGRRYDAAGRPIGAEFRVATAPSLAYPSVSVAGDERFIVVWQDSDFHGYGIFGQAFNVIGQPNGPRFRVNTHTADDQRRPDVALDAMGAFVVAWESDMQDGYGLGVFAQRFALTSVPSGVEFRVSTLTLGDQGRPTVASDTFGHFVIAWSGVTDGSGDGVFAQRFDSGGAPRGAEIRVNTFTAGDQREARIGSDPYGNFAVAWTSDQQDGDAEGVFGQRYGGLLPAALAVDAAGNGVLEPSETAVVEPAWRNVNGATLTFDGRATLTGPGLPWYLTPDGSAAYGAVADDATQSCAATGDCYVVATNPPFRPFAHWDAVLREELLPPALGQSKAWALHIGASFADVPPASPYYRFVETLFHHGVTGGCLVELYCPSFPTSREQMAVFVLVAKEGPGYAPPACATPMFADVPASSPFCPWVEELARRGVVAGCGGGNYCPTAAVTREQMAVFVLRTAEPASAPPPCATPVFADVPAASPFCRWIEELVRRGVVSGCGGGNYCPAVAVTREQMGVFIGVTFGLRLYGP